MEAVYLHLIIIHTKDVTRHIAVDSNSTVVVLAKKGSVRACVVCLCVRARIFVI
jgi:hypothetical protein